jgi:nucleoside triphosphate diphosphatase
VVENQLSHLMMQKRCVVLLVFRKPTPIRQHGGQSRGRRAMRTEFRDGGFKLRRMDVARDADSPQPSSQPRNLALSTDPVRAAALFEQSAAIMARLRAPGGCPWDREQSFDTIRKYTLEETYEVFDAIERRDFPHLAEELGDLLLQVLFYAEMAANEGHFTIADVLDHLNRKLIRRHPHVFGEEASRAAGNQAHVDPAVATSAHGVLRNWEEIKAAEKALHAADSLTSSRLDAVQRAMPALAEAAKLGAKAAKSGFDWPHWRDLLPKLAEETAELEAEAARVDQSPDTATHREAVEAELGDLLFTVVNLGRHLHVDAEMALRGSNLRFRQRFREMELASARPLEELDPAELEALWTDAKRKLALPSIDSPSSANPPVREP